MLFAGSLLLLGRRSTSTSSTTKAILCFAAALTSGPRLLPLPVPTILSVAALRPTTTAAAALPTAAAFLAPGNSRRTAFTTSAAATDRTEAAAIRMASSPASDDVSGAKKKGKDEDKQVNLLDLAAATVACTVSASRSILRIIENDSKNTRTKVDGSFVTDADFAAQGVIVGAIRSVTNSTKVRILGEESEEEMAAHVALHDVRPDDADIYDRTRRELTLRRQMGNRRGAGAAGAAAAPSAEQLPLSPSVAAAAAAGSGAGAVASSPSADDADANDDESDCMVDPSRVAVIVDPLDATQSYARGDYDCVSILIGVVVDNEPVFGVIGKPFGYTGYTPILDTGCVTIYGGTLVGGAYVAGGERIEPPPPAAASALSFQIKDLPRAVISSSRSKGVVHDFCVHLGEKGLVAPEPLNISGAGEKSLRLILRRENEALWFFPKAGTSLWDVAAPDALLRALGGRMTDKYGNNMDYSKTRDEADNVDGVVACIDANLHAECVRLFQEGNWTERA